MKRLLLGCAAVACITAFSQLAPASEKVLKMSTTTSTESSGLLDILLPAFEKDTGIKVKVVAKGTGAAIRDGMDGNVDIIFVHARDREEQFVAEGYGTKRYAVMHNDFVIIGPEKDPAGIREIENAAKALQKIASAGAMFISRGDDSGTHTMEQSLWKATGMEMREVSREIVVNNAKKKISSMVPAASDAWYVSIGQGMGKTITYAEEKQAYTLSDRGTYIKYKYGKTPAVDLTILCEGDMLLANPYGLIPVDPVKHAHVQIEMATQFAEWLISVRGQKLIKDYTLEGKQLFFPDAIDGAALN